MIIYKWQNIAPAPQTDVGADAVLALDQKVTWFAGKRTKLKILTSAVYLANWRIMYTGEANTRIGMAQYHGGCKQGISEVPFFSTALVPVENSQTSSMQAAHTAPFIND